MPANPDDLAHLLRRCGYLTTPALLSQWSTLELDQAVDKALDFSVNPPDDYTWVATRAADGNRITEIRRWWLDRMITAAAPLQERLTFFWHGHFATSWNKVSDSELLYDQNRLFRKHALGSLHQLTQDVSVGVAMILYLDTQNSAKGSPNENFARELMELFTLGVDQGYSQLDVAESARAWTGHSVRNYADGSVPTYEYIASRHDTTNKQIFGITKNWSGPEVITEIINGSLRRTCATFIVNKLWSFFAHPNPSATVLSALTDEFVVANMELRPLIRAMLLRPEFYSAEAKNGLIRTPVEWAVKLHQGSGLASGVTGLDRWLGDLGQSPFAPPNVAGWQQNEFWLTENNVWIKDDYSTTVAVNAVKAGFIADYASLTSTQLVQRGLDVFGITNVSAGSRAAMEAWMTEHRAANAGEARILLTRLIALSPDFGLA